MVPDEIRIPLRDGAGLAADIYRPSNGAPGPAILVQTPYGKERLGAALPHPAAHSWLDFWDRERYALVIVDWRGYHASKDAGGGLRAPHRGEDGYDLVEWIASREWCDGNVALWGPSALGRAALRTAAAHPPHLVCAVPLVCHMGHFYEDFYEGGVLKESHLRSVEALGFGMASAVRDEPLSGTGFWKKGEAECRPEELDVPLLFITGWYDLVTARTIELFERVRSRSGRGSREDSRILIGPWHHTAIDQRRQGELGFPGAAGEAALATRAFFDRWCRGVRDGVEPPPVRFWTVGEDGWAGASRWPPGESLELAYHLHPYGLLSPERPGGRGRRTFVDDPEHPVPTHGGANLPIGLLAGPYDQRAAVESRADVLVYTTEPLSEPVRLLGSPRVTLTASCDRVDTDLAVRLTEVWPDGRSMLVADSIRRARLRGSTAKPALLSPDVPFEVTMTLPPVAQTFAEGNRIRISVSGSNWPRFERNRHTGADSFDEAIAEVAETTLHFGGDARAVLTVPVRNREPETGS